MTAQAARKRLPSWLGSLRWVPALQALGTASAILIFLASNVLGARFFKRWDVTSEGLYTLSDVTLGALQGLREPVDVVVFLSRSDPLASSVRYMLDAYRSHSAQLNVRHVDPDREPAQFVALQRQYGIFEGKTQDGRLATEASVVIARGEKRWFVTIDDLVAFDEEQVESKPRLEAALTEGLVNVLGRDKVRLCFTQGHGELSISSGGPQGLSEYRARLEQNNYDVRAVDLAVGEPARALAGCDLVAVVGPVSPFAGSAASAFSEHVGQGGSLLLAIGPLVDEDGNILQPGLAALTSPWGIAFDPVVVFERDESLILPVGFGGEVFLANPQTHATTAGLLVGDNVRGRVVLQLAQALSLDAKGGALPLLRTSAEAVSVSSFRAVRNAEFLDAPSGAGQSRVLAAAIELSGVRKPESKNPARVVVLSSSSLLWSSTWLEPSLLGTRRFVENVTSWLAAQPELVSVPEKASQPAGLYLTEEALGEVQRYVLVYLPLSVLLLGALVLYRRHVQLAPAARKGEQAGD